MRNVIGVCLGAARKVQRWALIPALVLISAQRPAPATTGVFASEVTQLLNHAQLVLRYIQAAQHLISTLNQEQMAIQNLTHTGSFSFRNIAGDLNNLAGVIQGGQAIAYSAGQMDQLFLATYPGYGATFGANNTFYQQYASWSQAHVDTITGNLRGFGLAANQLNTEMALTNALRAQWGSSAGRLAALEQMAQTADQTLTSLMSLRQIMIMDATSKAIYQGRMEQELAIKAAAQANFVAPQSSTVQGDTRAPDPVH